MRIAERNFHNFLFHSWSTEQRPSPFPPFPPFLPSLPSLPPTIPPFLLSLSRNPLLIFAHFTEMALKRRSWYVDQVATRYLTVGVDKLFARSLSTEAGSGSRLYSTCISWFPLSHSLQYVSMFMLYACTCVHATVHVNLQASLSSSNLFPPPLSSPSSIPPSLSLPPSLLSFPSLLFQADMNADL